MTAAFEAAREGDLSSLEGLLDEGTSDVDARGENATVLLHVAAERNDVEMVEALLDRGADHEVEAAWGQTPFEWAANMNAQGAARVLLDRGADRLNLWTAAALGMSETVASMLRGAGADSGPIGRRPRPGARLEGWTSDTAFLPGDDVSDAFYIACRNGQLDVARMLLSGGADVDSRGYFGAPALHWAAGGGHANVVEWLIGEGADASIRDPQFGGDAASWAREFGHDVLAARIEELVDRPAGGES